MLIDTSNLAALPMAQKIELLERVSAALQEQEQDFEAPRWHKEVLSSREAELSQPHKWVSLKDARKRLAQ